MNEKEAITNVISVLEAEPSSDANYREQLAVLVASGKAKEMIGISLTQDQVKKLSEQGVKTYFQRYGAFLSSKTRYNG